MEMNLKKRGRPVSDKPAPTPTERQRMRRARIKAERFETFEGQTLSIELSGQAAMALRMLCYHDDKSQKPSQKSVIEKLLIQAYQESKKVTCN